MTIVDILLTGAVAGLTAAVVIVLRERYTAARASGATVLRSLVIAGGGGPGEPPNVKK
jgi:hypothetical protein